jgi:hypothetical protein
VLHEHLGRDFKKTLVALRRNPNSAMSESALTIGGETILRLRGDASPPAPLSPPRTLVSWRRRDS